MADLHGILSKVKEVASALAVDGEKDVVAVLAKVQEVVAELEAEVTKAEGAGEDTPTVPPADPAAGVQTSSDLAA